MRFERLKKNYEKREEDLIELHEQNIKKLTKACEEDVLESEHKHWKTMDMYDERRRELKEAIKKIRELETLLKCEKSVPEQLKTANTRIRELEKRIYTDTRRHEQSLKDKNLVIRQLKTNVQQNC